LPVVWSRDDLEDRCAGTAVPDLDDADFDAEEEDVGVGLFVEPVERPTELVSELMRDLNDSGGIQACGVHQALSEVRVVGPLELVLDDDDLLVLVHRLDVQPKLSDEDLGCSDRQGHAELIREHVDVLSEPRREIA
jgi:hypothetical protein